MPSYWTWSHSSPVEWSLATATTPHVPGGIRPTSGLPVPGALRTAAKSMSASTHNVDTVGGAAGGGTVDALGAAVDAGGPVGAPGVPAAPGTTPRACSTAVPTAM